MGSAQVTLGGIIKQLLISGSGGGYVLPAAGRTQNRSQDVTFLSCCFSGKSSVALSVVPTVDWSTVIAFAAVVVTGMSDSWILRRAKVLYLPLSTIRVFFSVFFWVSRLRHEASLVITSFALRARLGL
ncbi:hypothetical protein ARMSODRAFT_955544, partial [Armillaria solidipes]